MTNLQSVFEKARMRELTDRELDALVAERVMGWKRADRQLLGWGDGPSIWITGEDPDSSDSSPTYQDFRPSIDIAEAWRVAERIIEPRGDNSRDQLGFTLEFRTWDEKEPWAARFATPDSCESCWGYGTKAPRAICLAALKAKGVEVE